KAGWEFHLFRTSRGRQTKSRFLRESGGGCEHFSDNGALLCVSPTSRKEHLMPSPFPGMDPFIEANPLFQELHTQMLAEMQALLQPQLRPKYVARLERHGSEADTDELRKQRRIVIYVQDRPRLAVTGIELLSPGNKQPGAVAQQRYLEKRAS